MTPNNRAEFQLVLENQKVILRGLMALLLPLPFGAEPARDARMAAERTEEWLRVRVELFKS